LTFSGDTNTGIFSPAADTIAFSEGGVESMRIDSAGNVGIGTGSTINVSGMEISRATGVSPTPVELRLTTTTNDSGWSTSNPWGRISFYSADASVGGAKVHASIQTTAQSSAGGNSNLDFFVTDTANGNLYRTLSFQGAGTNTTQTVFYSGGGTEAARIDSSGNFQFNSGYGSVATAYGCRAWVNFNGTGTVAIRASGNVTSITDNGTGDYTVNFTTAMPDANYSFTGACQNSGTGPQFVTGKSSGTYSTTQLAIQVWNYLGNFSDVPYVNIAIFR
jgi:hypothetical protein